MAYMSVETPAGLFPFRSVGPDPAMITAAGQGPAPPGRVSVASSVSGPLVKCITESRIGPP
jgi:hypothetical protein